MQYPKSQPTKEQSNTSAVNSKAGGETSVLRSPGPAHDAQTGRDDATRVRAYEIFVKQGRPEGRAQAHWSQAERELSSFQSQRAAVGHAG